MRKLLLGLSLVCFSAVLALGQTKISSAWTCAKPSSMQSIPVGDKADHAYAIQQFKCTATKGEIGGVKEKEGTGTEFDDVNGNNASGHGIFVETLANGDKLHITYTTSAMMKNGQFESGSNKWEGKDGTGKVKGIKASGACTGKGNADGSASFTCTGSYTVAK